MSKPLRYTVSSILRQTPEQAQAVHAERRLDDEPPPYAEMCRRLIEEALAHRMDLRRFDMMRAEAGDSGQP